MMSDIQITVTVTAMPDIPDTVYEIAATTTPQRANDRASWGRRQYLPRVNSLISLKHEVARLIDRGMRDFNVWEVRRVPNSLSAYLLPDNVSKREMRKFENMTAISVPFNQHARFCAEYPDIASRGSVGKSRYTAIYPLTTEEMVWFELAESEAFSKFAAYAPVSSNLMGVLSSFGEVKHNDCVWGGSAFTPLI